MDIVRNVGNSTMRMMDEAGAQVLLSQLKEWESNLHLKMRKLREYWWWLFEKNYLQFNTSPPRQPTATLTTDGPACDRAPCAIWTPCTCDTMCKVQVVNMWHNVPTKPPPNLFSYWSAVINCVHPLWIKCPHKSINEMDLIREAWKGQNLMSSTEKDFDRSETKGQWSRKQVGPVFVELKGFGEWLIAYGCRDQECLAAKLCHMGSGQKCGSWSRAREIKESRL